ncbi:MerR family DNA-binding transcriptional regulator [Sinomonas mesophila]|uniref:MerR family DNA-binding transcriptional regulator n=1 Tax=Sinomonas mesophila TaxID=1531955 RepID=UPI00111551F6|nr:MerR family DNA-binding transcriptional regulator [Sinomonas mesophila]
MNTKVSRTHLPREVATALGISVDTVGRYAREGLIPFDTTPKGHRRFDIEEVMEALASERSSAKERLQARPAGSRRLVAGPEVAMSPQSRLREDLRATRTAKEMELPEPVDEEPNSAIDEVLFHSRRVLVAAGR